MISPEQLAEQFVSLAGRASGGSYHVRLEVPGRPAVLLGSRANPALARADVAAVREFVAAAIRAADPDCYAAPEPPALDEHPGPLSTCPLAVAPGPA